MPPTAVVNLDPPSSDPNVNRDMINAKILEAAVIGATVVGEGTYEVSALPSTYRYIKLQAGTKIRAAKPGALKFKLLPMNASVPAGSSIGLYSDDPDWWEIEDLEVEGSGEEMGHVILHSYSGTTELNLTFYKVKVTGGKFGVKIQGGRTNVRRVLCDFSGWGAGYQHFHAVNPDNSIPLDKIGARDEALGGRVSSYLLAGHELEREHCEYINPTTEVYEGGVKYDGSRFYSYQCNGPAVLGYGHVTMVDPEVTSACGCGPQTHPTDQMRIIRPKITPSGPVLAMNRGGVHTIRGYMRPVGHHPHLIYDNESLDYNGVLFEDTDIEGDPTEAFFHVTSPMAPGLGYVKKGGWLRQLTLDTPAAAVHLQKLPGQDGPVGANFFFDEGRIYIEKGRLWLFNGGAVGTFDGRKVAVMRGLASADSIIPAGASAFVK